MSIFPTKILLATDGSREAELAARTAADLSHKTDSELHVLHVLALPLDTHDPSSFEPEVWARLERGAQRTLEDVVGKIEASGGEVEGSRLTAGLRRLQLSLALVVLSPRLPRWEVEEHDGAQGR
jgi:nucleotide-binding universal stress UspA family protein